MIRCCKNCEARAVGCHSDCAVYIAEKAELTAENERERIRRDDYRGFGVPQKKPLEEEDLTVELTERRKV